MWGIWRYMDVWAIDKLQVKGVYNLHRDVYGYTGHVEEKQIT